jgi:hypothetical protein
MFLWYSYKNMRQLFIAKTNYFLQFFATDKRLIMSVQLWTTDSRNVSERYRIKSYLVKCDNSVQVIK